MSSKHEIKARRVQFELSNSPVIWLPEDPYSSHLINGIHLILPAGEFWFCRVFNQAMPYITNEELKSDVEGFIRQEAVHARVHLSGQGFLESKGFNLEPYLKRLNWLFETALGDSPFGISWLAKGILKKPWLKFRVGLIATVEHFTGLLGHWCLNSKGWDDGDPVVTDLFRWHLAEEVEHRTVAYDLYRDMCSNKPVFYVTRILMMLLVFPVFLFLVWDALKFLCQQDENQEVKQIGKISMFGAIKRLQTTGNTTDRVPSFSYMLKHTIAWFKYNFHPITEGDTQQALDYFAKSPAAIKAATQ